MALWDDRVGESRAWEAAEDAAGRLEELTKNYPDDELLGRASRVLAIARTRLQALDPDLAIGDRLQAFGADIGEMIAAVSDSLEPAEGATRPDASSVTQRIDKVVRHIVDMPHGGVEEAVAVTEVFRRQQTAAEEQARAAIDEGRREVEKLTGALTKQIAAHQGEASELETKLTEMQAGVEQMKTDLDGLIAEKMTAADTAAKEASETHKAARERAKEAADTLIDEARKAFEAEAERERTTHQTLVADLTKTADGFLAVIEARKEQVETLAGAVGRTGLSAGFQQWEKAEGELANSMRKQAIVLGIAAAVAVGVLLVARLVIAETTDLEPSEWAFALAALTFPGALGGVALYAGRESALHRRNQTIARRTELDLNSFIPFLAELDKEDRDLLTAAFTEVFFGQATAHTTPNRDVDNAGPRPVLGEILNRMAQRVRKPETAA